MLRRYWRRVVLSGLMAGLFALSVASPTMAQNGHRSGGQNGNDVVTLNFVNADIEAVIRTVSEITGRNFIIDPKVKGTVNIISTQPVSRELVYPTLLSALRLQGIAAVEGEGVVRIVPETDAKQYGGSAKAGGDQLMTKVIPLRYESATPMVGILRPLVSPNNSVLAFPGSNALVITDYAENMKRLERIVASLDQPPAGEPLMVQLKNASALDMVPMLNKLFVEGATSHTGTPGGDTMQRVALVADPRSNSVLIRSDNPGRAERVREFIEKLDVPGRPEGNIFIIYLKNADAQSVAQTLQGVLTGNSAGAATHIAKPATPNLNASSGSLLSSGTASAMANIEPLPFAPPQEGGVAFSANGITVQADTATNSLVVMAPEPVYNTIRTVVEKLDVPRAQVFVEALIVEVDADKAAEFGIQWNFLSDKSGTRPIGGTNFGNRNSGQNILDITRNPLAAGPGLNIGVVDRSFYLPGIGYVTNIGFLARALETQVRANILSTPTLLTLDNQEARIMVGQNVPLLSGKYSTTGSSSTVEPFQTFERQDVGLMLRIKPQITENGTVRMNIYQEVSRVVGGDNATTSGLVISKRYLESAVAVDDSQIVVLGGLVEDRMEDNANSVPILGDIPILGHLFRYDSRSRQKSNLLIFLKPTIVRSAADSREYTTERYRYLMGEQRNLAPQERFFWTDPTIPELLPQTLLPGSEKPLPTPPRGEPLPSGAMLVSPLPFLPERTLFNTQPTTP
ncbi:MAG: type II secretion system secretin GspD [Proteobacteria bacterium]|nr:type II secretion system secretin GspD [Pseudomonadota bacterium]MCL2306985.1 type II secretion system secretin GspD [Pseudomonadota bacterium]